MPDRREYKRFEVTGSVIFKVGADQDRSITAELVNISFLGICVYAPEVIEPGTKVHFEFNTKFSSDPIIGKGEIKHCGEIIKKNAKVFRIGMAFTQVDAKLLQHLFNRIHVVSFTDVRHKEQQRKKKLKSFSLDF